MDSAALVAIGTVIGTALGGIFVTVINAWLAERIKTANQRDIERLKIDLGRAAFEYQTRFARLHDRRIAIIGELYEALVATERAFHAAVGLWRAESSKESERRQERDTQAALEAMTRLDTCFRANEVWLDEPLARHLATFEQRLLDAWVQYSDPDPKRVSAEQRTDAWLRVVETEVPPLKDEIRAAMRERLEPALPASDEARPARTGTSWMVPVLAIVAVVALAAGAVAWLLLLR